MKPPNGNEDRKQEKPLRIEKLLKLSRKSEKKIVLIIFHTRRIQSYEYLRNSDFEVTNRTNIRYEFCFSSLFPQLPSPRNECENHTIDIDKV